MLARSTRLQPLLVTILFCALLFMTNGLSNDRLFAQATDLTTLNDAAITAYRWQAMSRFYTSQTTAADLTTLNDAATTAYRWQAMARFYTSQAAATDLTTLNDAAITNYRWQALAQFYTKQIAARTVTR